MKPRSRLKRFLCLLCLLLTGCMARPSLSLDGLLQQVNLSHQEIGYSLDGCASYLRTESDLPDLDTQLQTYYNAYYGTYSPARELTSEQAQEDVRHLFEALYMCYGLYDYLGGKPVFDAAEKSLLAECGRQETLTCEELEALLVSNLAFIPDGHFKVNDTFTAPRFFPFFFRETAFYKTDAGYQTAAGKTVQSVEGYDDLDSLFRLSISGKGELVYYPVLLRSGDFNSARLAPQTCGETLRVHYTDGTAAELSAEPYQVYDDPLPDGACSSLRQEQGIPICQTDHLDLLYRDELLAGAAQLGAAPLAILDLRSDHGGTSYLPAEWMKSYAGQTVLGRGARLDAFLDEAVPEAAGPTWTAHDGILIVLTGKYTASAAEIFLDLAHSVENVLIIGENSHGALGSSSGRILLPNSLCSINIGAGLVYLTPEAGGYFEELRGFLPDIWVPAGEAEELTLKLLRKNNLI